MTLEITKQVDDDISILVLQGDLDTGTASQLEEVVKEIISAGNPKIIFDMAGINYISSFGLRVVIYTAKAMRAHGDKFAIHSAQEDVVGIFQLSGLSRLLKIVDSPEAARAAVSG